MEENKKNVALPLEDQELDAVAGGEYEVPMPETVRAWCPVCEKITNASEDRHSNTYRCHVCGSHHNINHRLG